MTRFDVTRARLAARPCVRSRAGVLSGWHSTRLGRKPPDRSVRPELEKIILNSVRNRIHGTGQRRSAAMLGAGRRSASGGRRAAICCSCDIACLAGDMEICARATGLMRVQAPQPTNARHDRDARPATGPTWSPATHDSRVTRQEPNDGSITVIANRTITDAISSTGPMTCGEVRRHASITDPGSLATTAPNAVGIWSFKRRLPRYPRSRARSTCCR